MNDPKNPPAFPRDHRHIGHNGLEMRDWFAGQALLSIGTDYYASGKIDAAARDHAAGLAEHAYVIADAMLAARGEA